MLLITDYQHYFFNEISWFWFNILQFLYFLIFWSKDFLTFHLLLMEAYSMHSLSQVTFVGHLLCLWFSVGHHRMRWVKKPKHLENSFAHSKQIVNILLNWNNVFARERKSLIAWGTENEVTVVNFHLGWETSLCWTSWES